MSETLEKIKDTMDGLDRQIEAQSTKMSVIANCLNPVIARIDKIIAGIVAAHENEKSPSSVCVDELLKLRNDLMATLITSQSNLATIAGQRSGLEAAKTLLDEDAAVQRTKERIETGDLDLDRPRSLGERPESLKNVRTAQEEIKKTTMFKTDT